MLIVSVMEDNESNYGVARQVRVVQVMGSGCDRFDVMWIVQGVICCTVIHNRWTYGILRVCCRGMWMQHLSGPMAVKPCWWMSAMVFILPIFILMNGW